MTPLVTGHSQSATYVITRRTPGTTGQSSRLPLVGNTTLKNTFGGVKNISGDQFIRFTGLITRGRDDRPKARKLSNEEWTSYQTIIFSSQFSPLADDSDFSKLYKNQQWLMQCLNAACLIPGFHPDSDKFLSAVNLSDVADRMNIIGPDKEDILQQMARNIFQADFRLMQGEQFKFLHPFIVNLLLIQRYLGLDARDFPTSADALKKPLRTEATELIHAFKVGEYIDDSEINIRNLSRLVDARPEEINAKIAQTYGMQPLLTQRFTHVPGENLVQAAEHMSYFLKTRTAENIVTGEFRDNLLDGIEETMGLDTSRLEDVERFPLGGQWSDKLLRPYLQHKGHGIAQGPSYKQIKMDELGIDPSHLSQWTQAKYGLPINRMQLPFWLVRDYLHDLEQAIPLELSLVCPDHFEHNRKRPVARAVSWLFKERGDLTKVADAFQVNSNVAYLLIKDFYGLDPLNQSLMIPEGMIQEMRRVLHQEIGQLFGLQMPRNGAVPANAISHYLNLKNAPELLFVPNAAEFFKFTPDEISRQVQDILGAPPKDPEHLNPLTAKVLNEFIVNTMGALSGLKISTGDIGFQTFPDILVKAYKAYINRRFQTNGNPVMNPVPVQSAPNIQRLFGFFPSGNTVPAWVDAKYQEEWAQLQTRRKSNLTLLPPSTAKKVEHPERKMPDYNYSVDNLGASEKGPEVSKRRIERLARFQENLHYLQGFSQQQYGSGRVIISGADILNALLVFYFDQAGGHSFSSYQAFVKAANCLDGFHKPLPEVNLIQLLKQYAPQSYANLRDDEIERVIGNTNLWPDMKPLFDINGNKPVRLKPPFVKALIWQKLASSSPKSVPPTDALSLWMIDRYPIELSSETTETGGLISRGIRRLRRTGDWEKNYLDEHMDKEAHASKAS